ncbi:hypothetical protein DAPPUDRAFT_326319 [Daphnia pulex]|uniref:Uncharacterized protein n=1 Tax=Daphnia pulex TaxID=6669 RepID=E9H7D1_DAPPU|nr:hypothetical protein DAPPUDRAFT_326319 [Daphnia pulex]|eukprot:EFX72386.1 hypothetical protein DAPPUDRAFT_326319 [Daphnia pulex]
MHMGIVNWLQPMDLWTRTCCGVPGLKEAIYMVMNHITNESLDSYGTTQTQLLQMFPKD